MTVTQIAAYLAKVSAKMHVCWMEFATRTNQRSKAVFNLCFLALILDG